jgi:hypothetical protein
LPQPHDGIGAPCCRICCCWLRFCFLACSTQRSRTRLCTHRSCCNHKIALGRPAVASVGEA